MMGGMGLELGLALLILLVFFTGLLTRGEDKRRVGVLAAVGLVVLLGLSFRAEPGAVLFGGTFVQDELAIFSKRLFLLATLLGVLGSLGLRAPTFARRATEYYMLMLGSLLGMLVLASARELILLFVAFELMSIPLYVMSGFRKGEEESVEAALKFFLIGTVSSAFIAYGLSFVYGISKTTDLSGVAAAAILAAAIGWGQLIGARGELARSQAQVAGERRIRVHLGRRDGRDLQRRTILRRAGATAVRRRCLQRRRHCDGLSVDVGDRPLLKFHAS